MERTEEQGTVGVSVDQPVDRRVLVFMHRVKHCHRVIDVQRRRNRDELPSDRVVQRIRPVYHTEDVRRQTNGHGGIFDSLYNPFNKVLACGYVCDSQPAFHVSLRGDRGRQN